MMNTTSIGFDENLLTVQDRLLYFARSLTRNTEDARDLLQESVLRALANKEKFVDGTNFKAWMMTIIRNVFINEYRRTKRGRLVLENADRNEVPVMCVRRLPDPASELATNEMNAAITKLPELFREPFRLNFQGFKYHEIADTLGIPIGTVKSRIFQARRQLISELGYHRNAA